MKTHQTGSKGKKVQRLYIEEATDISKEFYLSCLVDRASSKIAFISSAQGGMDIEEVAIKNPKKIFTFRLDYKEEVSNEEADKIVSIFNLKNSSKDQVKKIIQSIYQVLIKTDASLIEINPLVITKDGSALCLDAKINFDDNALYRHPDILSFKDLDEEDKIEAEARKQGLSYIKLNGKIGCMVNGAGLAMATMDIIKLYGSEPANFLDVGGGASKEKVSSAFKIILSDKNVKGILINIFGGIVRCDRVAQGVIDAMKTVHVNLPVIVRLEGTNAKKAGELLNDSPLDFLVASSLSNAAEKAVSAAKGGAA